MVKRSVGAPGDCLGLSAMLVLHLGKPFRLAFEYVREAEEYLGIRVGIVLTQYMKWEEWIRW